MNAIFQTDRGMVRHHNEDYGGIFFQNQTCLAIVADGMGGHNAGEVASQMAVARLEKIWGQVGDISFTPEMAETWLRENIYKVNKEIYHHSLTHEECEGMGTTVIAAICTEAFATIAHIGDSRCYVMNDNGFKQITDDHTLVNELIKSGQIAPEDAEFHPRKNVILRAVGTESEIEMDIITISFEMGDQLLICSDGLSNKVTIDEMTEILNKDIELNESAEMLIKLANEYGGEDNISVAIVKSGSESGCHEC